ncbi:hypothetical protein [Yokenella regensburgei]|uniref:EcoKI restriction-modification system protein HsdS n=1 Tax=Yokenella regensburgei TaxID=158877 RepID=A0AB38FWA6_9ENTR|nr:hypothetical protein [Yokenella regensburgei]KFD25203.1 type I restriction-modification system, specificity subunit S [Yokenella regensburgei ATCC 49455]SQA63239.1 EcoKI restriction-modification system protein HsdS [Yokenella regensburgei]SQA68659.1 EcoKI restriction-modification system protein HsdS [Yokenella regensburgei]SUQ06974.1 EcoKI restriction-modification system protein HsdS [Yokenella regensburgei]
MAKYKAYPEYKDSGVEWLGAIPEDWSVTKLKYIADLLTAKSTNSDDLFVGLENISSGDGKYISKEENIADGASVSFEKNDVLFGKLRPYLAKSWLATFSGVCSSEFLVLRTAKLHPKYLNYYSLTNEFIEQVNSSTYGSKMPRASWEFIGLLPVPTCSYSLSEKVAWFLDHETAKIDNLIEKQQQLIELLKEKRQTVISNAVNIRNNERKTKLKNLVNIQTGYPFPSAKFKFSPDNSIPLLRGVNVGVDSIKWDDVVYWDVCTLERLNEYLLVAGDIVFGMDRPWISSGARVSEIKEQDLPCLLLQRVARIRSNIKSYQPFIKLCLSSNEFREYAEMDLTGVSVPHISPEQISNFYVRDIPFDDQFYLTKNALEKIGKIELNQEMAEQAIQLLHERRTALISAAVTGKIDVRDWIAPDTQEAEESQEATA